MLKATSLTMRHTFSHSVCHVDELGVGVGVQGWLLQMVAASTFAIIAAALEAHTHEAARRGWALPTQLHKGMLFHYLLFFGCLLLSPPHTATQEYALFLSFWGFLLLSPRHTATHRHALPACLPLSPPRSNPSFIYPSVPPCLTVCGSLSARLSLPACLPYKLSCMSLFFTESCRVLVERLWDVYILVVHVLCHISPSVPVSL